MLGLLLYKEEFYEFRYTKYYSFCFPIALSMYLLIRIEGKLQTLTDSINELSKNIISMR